MPFSGCASSGCERSHRPSGSSTCTCSALRSLSSRRDRSMSVPDLAGLLRALVDERVEFVLIGGLAVAAHGFVRATEDLDLVPAPDRDNLDRLLNRLVREDARLTLVPDRVPGPEERRALYRGRNLSVSTRLGDVDIVQRLPGVPSYSDLAARAVVVAPFGLEVRVASRSDLIAMKRAGGRAIDVADLERLEGPPDPPEPLPGGPVDRAATPRRRPEP
jgi:hypothetical protein